MIDMVTLMENVEWISSGDIREWCDEDPTRHTLLLEALNKDLEYSIEDDGTDRCDLIGQHEMKPGSADCTQEGKPLASNSKEIIEGDGTDHRGLTDQREIKHGSDDCTHQRILLACNRIEIEAKVFKQWYYSIWPPEDTVESHMSRDLKIAVQCCRDLYRDGDLSEKSATIQNKEIKKWLKNNHPEIQSQPKRHDRIMLIVKHAP